METPVKCNIFKIFRVARCKRINLYEVNLINLFVLLTRDTFSFPPSIQSVEWGQGLGWCPYLGFWDETGGTIYLSNNPEFFWQPSTTRRLVYM